MLGINSQNSDSLTGPYDQGQMSKSMPIPIRCFLLGPLTRRVRCDDQRLQHIHIIFVPCGIRGRLLPRVMAAADVGLPGIGDRVYQKMVRRYRESVGSR